MGTSANGQPERSPAAAQLADRLDRLNQPDAHTDQPEERRSQRDSAGRSPGRSPPSSRRRRLSRPVSPVDLESGGSQPPTPNAMISPLDYQSQAAGGPLGYGQSPVSGGGPFSNSAIAAAAAAAGQGLVSSNGCAPLFSSNTLLSQAGHQAVVALVGSNQPLLYGAPETPDTKQGLDELCPVCGDKVSSARLSRSPTLSPFPPTPLLL